MQISMNELIALIAIAFIIVMLNAWLIFKFLKTKADLRTVRKLYIKAGWEGERSFFRGYTMGIKTLINKLFRSKVFIDIDVAKIVVLANDLPAIDDSDKMFMLKVDGINGPIRCDITDVPGKHVPFTSDTIECFNCGEIFNREDIKRYPEAEGDIPCPHCQTNKIETI